MRPSRETIRTNDYAYFVSTQTVGRTPLFRHERWARLMLDVLKHYDSTGYKLHAYVIMPDHLHLLMTPTETVEKSMQLVKGGFSFRAKKELEWREDIWQEGFTDHRIRDEVDWQRHLEYIRTNPIEAHLVADSILYRFMGFPESAFPKGLKPDESLAGDVRAEARTLQARPSLEMAPGAMESTRQRVVKGTIQGEVKDQGEVKGTGFSPSKKAVPCPRALASEGGKR